MNMKFWIIIVFIIISIKIKAQNIAVGSIDFMEERSRNEQLLGRLDSLVSFTLRPLPQSLINNYQNNLRKDKVNLQILPISLTQQYNTSAPSGWNDGSMVPAKGYQTLLTAGLYANYGPLKIQIKPEYVYAANPDFETFPLTETNNVRIGRISYLNTTDLPERLGDQKYNQLNWGQSSIRLDIKKMSMGISTENLWWGPGNRNSLIMSNNAPGFLHFTINTREPIKTFLGSFEAQLISGKLKNSGFDSPDADYIVDGMNYKLPKEQEWRYLSGLSINYHPKWVPGLFVGLNRVFQIYNNSLGSGFSDYFPVITPFQKDKLKEEDAKDRDQVASLFIRWFFKESKTEFYFENGWNDHSQDILDLFESPSHSRAFLFGFSKIFILNSNKDNYLKFNFENTQLQQSADRIVRPAGAWYQHGIVRNGYTNMSQVIGAGIGPGSNSQTLDFSVWSKQKVWGIQLERFAHNLDFYYDVYDDYGNKWVDFNINSYIYRKYKNWGVNAKFNTSLMDNYQWQKNNFKLNMQLKVTLQYHF
ncbi:hypothetical protein HNQ02_001162 [Flavobacterium sp. 7E]|uniref:capsule assembly Wzi family protein n=1 Tax=Flavobacterium sp. 7E TaxID=2735898 RepID=UPI00156DDDBA|nr:capsule assembly Wzi family protein [Flavobacterium sp. 7E]NRS88248.1 hypothetical protein [Flavobacterium sp. 7E]